MLPFFTRFFSVSVLAVLLALTAVATQAQTIRYVSANGYQPGPGHGHELGG